MNLKCDIAIIGSGFGGSLMAMIVRRLGHSVVMLERGRHPRFAIGESSTPLANLLLEELAGRYDLPEVASLAKWGTWQRDHPQIACGLKRGFSFYHHRWNEPWKEHPNHENELLVAASPNDTISDTHWYRPDFDYFLLQEAQTLGACYLDETQLHTATSEANEFVLHGVRNDSSVEIHALFVIDASGPRGFLQQALGLAATRFANLPATEALYTHFTNVARWDSINPTAEKPPFPVDDAAVHHVFEGGWIWALRFNNGITSAGVAASQEVARRFLFSDGESAWNRLLSALPSVEHQFSHARPSRPFVHAPALSFRAQTVTGHNWALLPSAAGFVDPLLSNGFPLTLLGIERLASAIALDWGTDRLVGRLEAYGRQTLRELDVTADLIGSLYANMSDFESFKSLSMLYFAAAMTAETRRRMGTSKTPTAFLLENDPTFGHTLRDCLRLTRKYGSTSARTNCNRALRRAIEPINLAHLGDPARRNWYPCLAEDLFEAAPKLGATKADVERLLARCGFSSAV